MRGLKNIASLRKKSQGLSLNTVVIAVIVVIVLLLMIAIFILGIGDFEDDRDPANTCDADKVPDALGECCNNLPAAGPCPNDNRKYDATIGSYRIVGGEKNGHRVGACCNP